MHVFRQRSTYLVVAFFFAGTAGTALWLYAVFSSRQAFDLARFRLMAGRMGRELSSQSIHSIDLEATVEPLENRLHGRAMLEAEFHASDQRDFVFFLNPGLVLTSASVNGQSVSIRRNGSQITLTAAQPFPSDEPIQASVEYEGIIRPTALCATPPHKDQIVLSPFLYWYPFDFKSFPMMKVACTLPQDLTLVAPPNASDVSSADQTHTVSWQIPRPVFSMALIAGRLERARRLHGEASYDVYWPSGEPLDPEPYFQAVSAAHGDFSARYGTDNFHYMAVVLSPACGAAFNAGDSSVVLPWRSAEEMDDTHGAYGLFMRLAPLVARNWWGGTVSGRWLTDKPEAGAWLNDSMAEYGARTSLLRRYGRSAYLQYLENTPISPAIPAPLNTVGQLDMPLAGKSNLKGDAVRAYGPALAQMLALRVGTDAFDAACRSLFRVYRYSTVSYASFRQELELASAADLGESFHAWFDRPGAFDYALMELHNDPHPEDLGPCKVSVTIQNNADFPAMSPMRIAFWTPTGVEFRSCDPGGAGGVFEFTLSGPANRAVLDPEFETADMARANNIWPRRTWPIGVRAAANGSIAWWTVRDWRTPMEQNLSVLLPGGDTIAKATLAQPITSGPLWSPDGEQLAWISAGREHSTAVLYIWDLQNRPRAEPHIGMQCLGQWDDDVLAGWRTDQPEWVLYKRSGTVRTIPAGCLPSAVSASHGNRPSAYISEESGVLNTVSLRFQGHGDSTETQVLSQIKPYGAVESSPADGACFYFDRMAGLMRIASPDSSPLCICPLGTPVRQPAFSPDVAQAGWVDPSGRLTLVDLRTGRQTMAPFPGEIISWSWVDRAHVAAITAERTSALPLLSYAEYTLWRLATDTLEPERIPVNPSSAP